MYDKGIGSAPGIRNVGLSAASRAEVESPAGEADANRIVVAVQGGVKEEVGDGVLLSVGPQADELAGPAV